MYRSFIEKHAIDNGIYPIAKTLTVAARIRSEADRTHTNHCSQTTENRAAAFRHTHSSTAAHAQHAPLTPRAVPPENRYRGDPQSASQRPATSDQRPATSDQRPGGPATNNQ